MDCSLFRTFSPFHNSLRLLYCISRTTRLSKVKSNGKYCKGHSNQQIHINTLESSLKDPVRCTPLICSKFKHLIFANDPVFNDLAFDAHIQFKTLYNFCTLEKITEGRSAQEIVRKLVKEFKNTRIEFLTIYS